MTDHLDETRRGRRQRGAAAASPAGAPLNSSDVLWEIFLRLPPLPSSLPRISLVCKWWRRLAADPEFLLRFRTRHRKAPLLGLFKEYGGWVSFTPVLNAPNRIPRRRFSMRIDYGGAVTETYPSHGTLLGCRHGRVLVHDPLWHEALVCDPITGEQQHLALPPELRTIATTRGAVLCTNGNERHVHGGCHSSPFKVVLVKKMYEAGDDRRGHAVACVYSSETGTWSKLISAVERCRSNSVYIHLPSTLAGGSLYWWLRCSSSNTMEILQFDIGRGALSIVDGPPVKLDIKCTQIIQGEDGGVGVAVLSYPSLQMWDLKVAGVDDVATWVLWKTISLNLVPNMRATETEIVGYVEDDDALLIKFNNNVFIVQLDSTLSQKLCESFVTHRYHPFTSFYSSGEFGRCKGIARAPSIAQAIERSKQQAPSLP